jgi:hypothetical protein
MALDLLPIIINVDSLNSQLTTDAETDEPFLIVEDWHEVAILQRELNKWCSPIAFFANKDRYIKEQGNEAFRRMRFDTDGHSPYLMPEGLFELDDIVDFGFSDEWMTCYNCGRAICTTQDFCGDKPRYAIVNDELLCGDCITTIAENDYIESVTNNPENALNTSIISEKRLTELGWKELSKKYENGLHQGMNDNPKKIYKRLKKFDVLFTYEPSQFYIEFYAWIKKPSSDDEG